MVRGFFKGPSSMTEERVQKANRRLHSWWAGTHVAGRLIEKRGAQHARLV